MPWRHPVWTRRCIRAPCRPQGVCLTCSLRPPFLTSLSSWAVQLWDRWHYRYLTGGSVCSRAGGNSERIGVDQFNSNSIPELKQELELKDLKQDELNWNWKILNWMKRNWASNICVMLWRLFVTLVGVLQCRQWCLVTNNMDDEAPVLTLPTEEWEVSSWCVLLPSVKHLLTGEVLLKK